MTYKEQAIERPASDARLIAMRRNLEAAWLEEYDKLVLRIVAGLSLEDRQRFARADWRRSELAGDRQGDPSLPHQGDRVPVPA